MDYYENKYLMLLIGETMVVDCHILNEILSLMNTNLNINTLSIQKSGELFYIRVDDNTKKYYKHKSSKYLYFKITENDDIASFLEKIERGEDTNSNDIRELEG